MISASEKMKGHMAEAAAVVVWGSTFVSTKVLLCDFSPVEILLISFQNGGHMSFHFKGDLCGLLVAIVWAVYSICMEKLDEDHIDSVLMTRRIFFYGLLFIILLAVIQGVDFTESQLVRPVDLSNFLYLGVIACALSFLIWNYATVRIVLSAPICIFMCSLR